MTDWDDSDSAEREGRLRSDTSLDQSESLLDSRGVSESSSMELEGTGIAQGLDDLDGFRQPTAMFDRGEFLGELAEELNDAPETRVKVETEKPPAGFRLIIVSGPGIGTEWAFKKTKITIGRSAENEIDFADIAVSRNHAEISFRDGCYYVSDLESNNGTLLNGVNVESEQLQSGDEIIVGARTLRFVELDEAPLTSAAHPEFANIDESDADDHQEALAEDPDASENAMQSQLNVDVIPDLDGPNVSDSVSAAAIVAAPKKKNTGIKVISLVLGGIAVMTLIGYLSVQAYQSITKTSPEDRRLRANTLFFQGIELLKQQRCGDALILFDEVLSIRPEYSRAKEYHAYCTEELEHFQRLQEARKLFDAGKGSEAIATLSQIPKDSQYHSLAASLSSKWGSQSIAETLKKARAALQNRNYGDALELVNDVLQRDRNNSEALALLTSIENSSTQRPAAVPISSKLIPSALQNVVKLYRAGDIQLAVDAAELSRSEEAAKYVDMLRQLQAIAGRLRTAHRQKAGADILRIAPRALSLDKKLGYGQGVLRQEFKRMYADGLYLKGLEAYVSDDFATSYSYFRKALSQQSSHKLSSNYVGVLAQKARVLYFEADLQKTTNRNEAARLFGLVTKITSPSNEFHKKSKKWLKRYRR